MQPSVYSSTPASAVDLIRGLDESHPAVALGPMDLADEASRLECMFEAGKRELIENLILAYKLDQKEGR